MQCHKCSIEISDNSKFCPNCGVEISKYNKDNLLNVSKEELQDKSEEDKKYDYYLSLKIDPKVIDRDKQIGSDKYLKYNSSEYKAQVTSSDEFGCSSIFVFILLLPAIWFICAIEGIEDALGVSVVVSFFITVIYIA